ncbi:hypothetical protein HON36_03670 [Candidatus Parcubacteria bacterium]|jgi:hypothetical protein|nr:hypothetical protein [Candidatus Parcubacteria bacterium]MBT7227906.1 hypothetical protein [Candidatus Parcubacteria bacterium]
MRQRLADLMALVIVMAVIAMISGADIIPDNRDDYVPPMDETGSAKYPVARIELTLEKLLKLMGNQLGFDGALNVNPVTA